jgi:hypothetical protein
MTFTYKLATALSGTGEARRMVRDPNTPIATRNILGWQVLFYDMAAEKRAKEASQMATALPKLKGRVDQFISTFPTDHHGMQKMVQSVLALMRQGGPALFDAIAGVEEPTVEATSEIYDATHEMIDDVAAYICHLIGISYSLQRKMSLRSHGYDPRLPPLQNLTKTITVTLRTMPKQLKMAIEPLEQGGAAGHRQPTAGDIDAAGRAIGKGITALRALNVRKLSRVPVRVHFVDDLPASGYGTELKLADAEPGIRMAGSRPRGEWERNRQDTQRINIYVPLRGDVDEAETIRSFLHEVGHILFNSSAALQQAVAKFSREMPAPSHYGSTGYVYQGADRPHVNHLSGNEWTAEMLRTVAMGDNHAGFTAGQIAAFKRALSLVDQAPHSGISYRLGQDKPWQRPV